MKKDIVLTSQDPYLLMRMFTDLQMDGRFRDDRKYNERVKFEGTDYLKIYHKDKTLVFFPYFMGIGYRATLIPLTESNYLETLKMILE
jgi:hypothetical protein